MKTVKFNEEEVELLVALYEDELKEAGSYIEKLKQTLNKLKNQAERIVAEPVKPGKKRGRKPKKQAREKIPAAGKKRGRKPRIQEAQKPVATKAEVKKTIKKKKVRKTRTPKLPKVVKPLAEEVKAL